jgi:hypothetical protein
MKNYLNYTTLFSIGVGPASIEQSVDINLYHY